MPGYSRPERLLLSSLLLLQVLWPLWSVVAAGVPGPEMAEGYALALTLLFVPAVAVISCALALVALLLSDRIRSARMLAGFSLLSAAGGLLWSKGGPGLVKGPFIPALLTVSVLVWVRSRRA